ncbi:hypothetical protein ACLIGD_03665 [Streptococcus equi subsp. zooepidemicus]
MWDRWTDIWYWLLEISNKNFGFVAIINASSFLISSIILVSIKSLLINNKEKITRHSFSRNFLEMYDASKGIFSTKSDSQFIKLITTVIISNVLGSAIIPIFNLYFLENKWQNFSYGQTLLILNTTMILGNILGSLFPKDFFSRLSLKKY